MGVARYLGSCLCPAGIELLLQSLEQLEHSYKSKSKTEDLEFLRDMLKAPEFHSLLDVRVSLFNV